MAGAVRWLEGDRNIKDFCPVFSGSGSGSNNTKFGLFGLCSGGMVSTTVAVVHLQEPEEENAGSWLQQWPLGPPVSTTSTGTWSPVFL